MPEKILGDHRVNGILEDDEGRRGVPEPVRRDRRAESRRGVVADPVMQTDLGERVAGLRNPEVILIAVVAVPLPEQHRSMAFEIALKAGHEQDRDGGIVGAPALRLSGVQSNVPGPGLLDQVMPEPQRGEHYTDVLVESY